MGLNIDTVCIHSGIKSSGNKDVLINNRGKVRNEPNANTVSELRVFSPMAREIPDQANPKNAIVNSISKNPTIPVTGVAPSRKAKVIIMDD